MVELGRVDIATECSLLLSHLAYPREGYFECTLNMMGYLKFKHNSCLYFDPPYQEIYFDSFNNGTEWREFYGDITEPIPDNVPDRRDRPVDLCMWVDSDHTGDKEARRSRTGFFIFVNTALINWLSKKQSTIEGSIFGAEIVTVKTGVETLEGICYKL